jgi:hypothetical protein
MRRALFEWGGTTQIVFPDLGSIGVASGSRLKNQIFGLRGFRIARRSAHHAKFGVTNNLFLSLFLHRIFDF